jgi:hypothetical protein
MARVFEAKSQGKKWIEVDRNTMFVLAGPDHKADELSFLGIELFINGKAEEILKNRNKSIVDNLFPKG